MHDPVRERIEELLADKRPEDRRSIFAADHLKVCRDCSSELKTMKSQSALLATLRAPQELDPDAGFYARVMQRIEQTAKVTIWSVFTDSPFGARLAWASLSLALAIGSYVVTQESLERHFAWNAEAKHFDAPVMGSQAQQRDAVLMNFAVHLQNASAQEGSIQ